MQRKYKILIIDDEVDVLAYYAALLEDNGYDCLTAESGIEGFSMAHEKSPDLITLDVSMPDQTGLKTFSQFKESTHLAGIPILIITATDDVALFFKRTAHQEIQPDGILEKPVNILDLLKKIEGILKSHKRRKGK
ncbi:response regulator [Desulfobacterales bacterium HSG17]|nr:response regulator [Desulfobacterales bacterium HSG17]